jgi:aminoglycoside 6-adenylyltransferase
MYMFAAEQDVLLKLWHWADQRHDIRVVVLTGSRAFPGGRPDEFSDFDLDVYVDDAGAFADHDAWWQGLGSAMVRWPLKPRTTFSPEWVTQLILFENGSRIDFQITDRAAIQVNRDAGYPCVLYHPPAVRFENELVSGRATMTVPSEAEYIERINAFWWDITYIPKALIRHELLYARYVLDTDIRLEKLHPLLRWHVGVRHGWSTDTGTLDRWMHRYADSEIWSRYLTTFAVGTIDDTWKAMFNALELVRDLGQEIGDALGFNYPASTDERVSAYIQGLRDGSHRIR